MGGYIMQLQNYTVNDGEGIRTAVFMAGCPLKCAWCANPEGMSSVNSMTHWAEAEDILKEIRRQSIFYRFSGGGVTFSGGEATLQPKFLKELTDALYDEGYDLALETCGLFDFDKIRPVLEKMNLIFMDLKHPDPVLHRKFTGRSNEMILSNITKTYRLGIPMVVRIPTVKGVNADDRTMEAAFAFLCANAPGVSLELLPYHSYGEDKYRRLGLPLPDSSFAAPSAAELSRWNKMACSMGLSVVSYR